MNSPTDTFMQYRGLVFRVAYDILGSVADAEDVMQQTYLRWTNIMDRDDRPTVERPSSYLAQIAANQSLNLLRAAQRSRESYVGTWLPEPLPDTYITSMQPSATPEDTALLDADISLALLVVLESLSPEERVAFVLHDVFGEPYASLATLLAKNEPAVRQLVHRARKKVHDQQPRHQVSDDEHNRVVEHFALAVLTGDYDSLTAYLASDVELISDGGGKARAAIRPVVGIARVARFIESIARNNVDGSTSEFVVLNGRLGVVTREGDAVVATFQFEVENGQVQRIYSGRNPDKFTAFR